jgi:hypothetical protein
VLWNAVFVRQIRYSRCLSTTCANYSVVNTILRAKILTFTETVTDYSTVPALEIIHVPCS